MTVEKAKCVAIYPDNSSVLITWETSSVESYQVNYWLEENPIISGTIETPFGLAQVRDIEPDKTYRISVTSINKGQESEEEPFGGLQFQTGKTLFAKLFCMDYLK